ncbi:MAG TPA: efflux RND transporter periplasmic adaptor subunit [Acidobacteriaceae bacterium]|jgi:RND family efflux transporter MFP subunit
MQHKDGTILNPPAQASPAQAQKNAIKKSAIKWFLLIPALLLLGGVAILLLRSRENRALAASNAASISEPVSVTYPQQRAASGEISLPSTLQAYADSPIYARTSGYLVHWDADIGSHVRQGQLLATIQSPEVDQELNQARALLSQTQANATLADVTAKRYQDLIHTNAVAQQEVDTSSQNLSAQKAALQAADANVKRLEQMQSFERVVAPFDGIITQRLINEGDLINAGNGGIGAQLFRISKISTMRVFIPVPEVYGSQIEPGLKADLTLTELPNETFKGAVVRTSHSIDVGSHTLLTEIDVPNPTGRLLPGAYANVHLRLAQQPQQLLVPTGAVLFQVAGPQVVVVNDKNQLELRKVALGNDLGNVIQITGGLATRDRVVASPPDYVVDGMPATIQSQAGANAGGSSK